MPNEVLLKQGTPKVWKASGGDHALTLTSLADDAAREGVKGDLGATFGRLVLVTLEVKMAVAPVAGNIVEVHLGWSTNDTAGSDNPAGLTGADAAYKAAEEDEWKVQATWGMNLILTADGSSVKQLQSQIVPALARYPCPLIVNKAGQALSSTAGDHILTMTPIIDEIQ